MNDHKNEDSTRCNELEAWLLDNDPRALPATLETHTAGCAGCREILATALELGVLGEQLGADVTACDRQADTILEAVRSRVSRGPVAPATHTSTTTPTAGRAPGAWFVWTAAAAVFVAGSVVGIMRLSERPADDAAVAATTTAGDARDEAFKEALEARLKDLTPNMRLAVTLLTRFSDGKGSADYAPLREDEALQAEYRALLDHESSNVRRSAMTALTSAGITLPAEHLLGILDQDAGEDMDEVLQFASSSAERATASYTMELKLRRELTVDACLRAVRRLAEDNPRIVTEAQITPHLTHVSPDRRISALGILSLLRPFSATQEVRRRLEIDSDQNVRSAAAHCLAAQVPEESFQWIADQVALESTPEEKVDLLLAAWKDPRVAGIAMALARDPQHGDRVLRKVFGTIVVHEGLEPARDLYERMLLSQSPRDIRYAVRTVRRLGIPEERARLFQFLQDASGTRKMVLAKAYISWCFESNPKNLAEARKALAQMEASEEREAASRVAESLLLDFGDSLPDDLRQRLKALDSRRER